MIPNKIVEAKKQPGKYVCKSAGQYFFIEVDASGQVHQLASRHLVRDGILSDDGWNDGPATQAMRVFRLEEL